MSSIAFEQRELGGARTLIQALVSRGYLKRASTEAEAIKRERGRKKRGVGGSGKEEEGGKGKKEVTNAKQGDKQKVNDMKEEVWTRP